MKNTVYPDIADTVLGSIRIPALPQEKREEYARPDTIKTYIPPELNEESDEEERRELERQKLIRKYRHKKIDRVTKKFKNATGQVKYNILWLDRTEEVILDLYKKSKYFNTFGFYSLDSTF